MRFAPQQNGSTRRQRGFGAGVGALVLSLVALAGCSSVDEEWFCNQFPGRSAGALLDLPEHELASDDPAGLTAEVMALSAEGLRKNPPEGLDEAVATYTDALTAWSPGDASPVEAPSVRESVDTIDRWLAQHCGPPETFAPPP